MDFPPAILPWVAALAGAAVALGLFTYSQLFLKMWRGGGKVRVSEFGPPDLFLGSFFLVWSAALVSRKSGGATEADVTSDNLIQSALAFGMIVVFVAAFLRLRGIRLRRQFGVLELPFGQALLAGLGFFLAVLPAVMGVGAVVQLWSGGDGERQTLVNFFVDAARNGEWRAMATTIVMGAVVAPITEEFLFRGYIYGVLKRYGGWFPALLINALLFAAIHLNAMAFLPLFVLAIALTLAYEITGSILVNMTMHALFNSTMLLALWQHARSMP